MSKFTFLEEEQIVGAKAIDIIKKRGKQAAITDFSILLGGSVFNSYHIDSDDSLEGRIGYYWTKTDDGDDGARIVYKDVSSTYKNVILRNYSARPALSFAAIKTILVNAESRKIAKDGVLEVEYGYYPQKATSKNMQEELEKLYKRGKLLKTKSKYTTDSVRNSQNTKQFKPKVHNEYEYNGKKYVRIEVYLNSDSNGIILSNGENYKNGEHVWVEVEPVKWLVDESAKLMITDKLIFAGIQFNHVRSYTKENFESTDIKKFMDEYFSKELEQNITRTEEKQVDEKRLPKGKGPEKKSRLQKLNPDKTAPSQRSKMTDLQYG